MNVKKFEELLATLQGAYAWERVIPVIDEIFGKSGYTRTSVGRSDSSCCGMWGIQIIYEKSGKPKAFVAIQFANTLVSLWLTVEGSSKKYSNLSYHERSTGSTEKSARLAWADVIDRPWGDDERSHHYDKKWED
jgi:hypothetical protein